MDTRAAAKEYRLAHWAEIVRDRQESGLSIKAYCEREGIHPNAYYYRQRKLREAACEVIAQGTPAIDRNLPAPQGWAVCEETNPSLEQQAVPAESGLTIEIGEFKIKLNGEVSSEQLSKVCLVLKALC